MMNTTIKTASNLTDSFLGAFSRLGTSISLVMSGDLAGAGEGVVGAPQDEQNFTHPPRDRYTAPEGWLHNSAVN
jgi:hypothetical protein